MIKVLVVDDSSFMRRSLMDILRRDPELEVVGYAVDGLDALAAIKKLDPDVVTLDVEMPRMNGLNALQKIMQEVPRPVLMVSALTSQGAETTLKALDAGALDFVGKPDSSSQSLAGLERELCQKVKAVFRHRKALALRAQLRNSAAAAAAAVAANRMKTAAMPPPSASNTTPPKPVIKPVGRPQTRDFVAIGVSTGGPPAVQKVLTALPADFPAPILIAQHMPASFT
ncbi:MAG: response regulator, partial [Deltaproteobacteria bacterium]|nr:response regulator [Deltaproteobacteria bacterium]